MANMPSPSCRTRRRYLCLALPYLSTDRIRRRHPGRSSPSASQLSALVVVGKLKNALRLVSLDRQAEGLGLREGQPLAEARAMVPGLEICEEDEAADRAVLESLADWAERYTPLVALDPPHGLMLDITGAAHLMGGEEPLVADLVMRLEDQGFSARAAIADTPGAAFAAACYGGTALVRVGGNEDLLRGLPFAALRLDNEMVAALDRVGLKEIGQIMEAPRAPLAARFGDTLLRRLDQALGHEDEAINPRRPMPALVAERRFAEPIVQEEAILATLASLAGTLCASLEERGEGARALELALFRVDGQVARTLVHTSRPIRVAKLILDLFREKFAGLGESFDVGFGFDMVRLAVPETGSFDAAQADFVVGVSAETDLGQLIDRIGTRLGAESIGRLAGNDTHIPERAESFRTIMDEGWSERDGFAASTATHAADPIDRPLRLFAKPELVETTATVPDGPPVRFRWRGALYRVARAEGPERIAPEWWREREERLTRDYFRVEDAAGRRFWLFREGLYEPEAARPRWYVHGLFA